jgi:hypothetical protein
MPRIAKNAAANRLAVHEYQPGRLDDALAFIKRTRSELRQLRFARVGVDFFQVYDVNDDFFEIRGLGYPDPDLVPILKNINAVYNPDTIHEPAAGLYKELKTGKCHPWAEDRVM